MLVETRCLDDKKENNKDLIMKINIQPQIPKK